MYLIVGCGLSGATVAERIASELGKKVLVIDKRNHIGGNCFDYIDQETDILVNLYGPHLFHTNNEKVWNYVNRFHEWINWEHKVLAYVDGQYVPMPVNISTVNYLCGTHIQTSKEMDDWLKENTKEFEQIENSEQMALSRIGKKLYDKLVKPYTFKQWNKYPEELDASVLARIPVRTNFDTRYFTDKYQALPKGGYTSFFQNLLNHPNIEVRLNTDFFEFVKQNTLSDYDGIIYTGPIDKYFEAAGLEALEYRSINFKLQRFKNTKYFQPNSQVNYPSMEYPFTRIVEYKHFLNQDSPHTIIISEESNDHGEPYYPVPNSRNLSLYEKYRILAEKEEKKQKVYFLGRLANYKYFNMDQAISNALEFFDKYLASLNN